MFEGVHFPYEQPRTYGDACGIARALDILGERWALMTVRELLLGPKRFTDLRAGLPHASPNILSMRLRDLEEHGIVRKRKLPPPAASQVYELTDRGQEIAPVLDALGTWGSRLPLPGPDATMSFDAHILSFRTLFQPDLAEGFERARRAAPRRAHVPRHRRRRQAASSSRARSRRPTPSSPPTTAPRSPSPTAAPRWPRPRRPARWTISGDREAAVRFLGLFPLPEPAAA